MGTMRLVLDARDYSSPAEVGVDQLGELLADCDNRLWLDISDPGPAEVALLAPKCSEPQPDLRLTPLDYMSAQDPAHDVLPPHRRLP